MAQKIKKLTYGQSALWVQITPYLDMWEQIPIDLEVNNRANLQWPLGRLEFEILDLIFKTLQLG